MKNNRIDLHAEPRMIMLVALLFTLVSLFLTSFLMISVNDDCIQLYSLFQSDYDYSAITTDLVDEHGFYQFDAGMDFILSTDADKSLNADIIMQSNAPVQQNQVCWDTDTLSTYGIAVSRNLANANDIQIGDRLYSKHIVNGELCEYTVEQILPETMRVRESEDKKYRKGIIIMGYDAQYIENVTYGCVVFSNHPFNEFAAKCTSTPDKILYKEDELQISLLRMLPYLVIMGLISIGATVLCVYLLHKQVSYNFRRLAMLGFEKKLLNRSLKRSITGVTVLSVIISLLCSSWIFIIVVVSPLKILLISLIHMLELVTTLIAARIYTKQLWRK